MAISFPAWAMPATASLVQSKNTRDGSSAFIWSEELSLKDIWEAIYNVFGRHHNETVVG